MLNTTSTPIRAQSSPFLMCVAFLIPFAVFITWHVQMPFGFVDDAYISMVYADNIASGHGIVFYPGGERVEGYTNPLWVILLSIAGIFQLSLPFIAYWMSMISAVGVILLVLAIYHKSFSRYDTPTFWNQYFFPCMAAVLTTLDVAFIAWSTSGLETLGFTLLLAWVCYFCVQRVNVNALCVLLLLLSLIRPEGILFLPLVFVKLLLNPTRKGFGFKQLFLIAILPYAFFLYLRYLYFGYWLPNTFYAKHDFGGWTVYYRGLVYAVSFFQPRLLLLIGIIGIALERETCKRNAFWILAFVLFHFLITIAEGGDHFALHRFLVPAVPLLSILAVRGLHMIVTRFVIKKLSLSSGEMVVMTHAIVAVMVMVIFAAHAMQLYEFKRDGKYGFSKGVRFHYSEVSWAEGWKNMGKWLKEKYPPDTKIAVMTAGAIPYYSQLPAIDILGINDPHIAHQPVADESRYLTGHEKSDADYVLSHEPVFIQLFPMMLFGSTPSTETDMDDMMTYPAQHDLRNHPKFQDEYAFKTENTPFGYISFFERVSQ